MFFQKAEITSSHLSLCIKILLTIRSQFLNISGHKFIKLDCITKLLFSLITANNIKIVIITLVTNLKCIRKKLIINHVNFSGSNVVLIKISNNC